MPLPPRTIEWVGALDGHVSLIDQTKLPGQLVMLRIDDERTMWEAIRRLSVRGAPAIGIAAAFGVVLGLRRSAAGEAADIMTRLKELTNYLAGARPTAVNLVWALQRMTHFAHQAQAAGIDGDRLLETLLQEAKTLRDEDAAMCRAIGRHGAALVHQGAGVLTHCNAGSLATAEYGTALAPLYTAHEQGRTFRAYACETRPLLQGARLTAWELQQAGIDVTLLCDSMAASLMRERKVDLVITGADRIAANGDTANKIGTYALAILAAEHGIPFYVAAPTSTFDRSAPDGDAIPIEYRDPDEIRRGFGTPTAPPQVPCYTPAFDVTPARLIRAIITDRGRIEPVTGENIACALSSGPVPPCGDT